MKSLCSVLALLGLSTLVLTGCGAGTSPNAGELAITGPAAPQAVPMPPLVGSVFGGHAPLVGAHVFVLEGQASSAGSAPNVGWYQPAKSLLGSYSSQSGQGYATAQDSSGDATTGDYYVTTNSGGEFNISGEYSCDAGAPVYLYASGGNPNTNPPITVTQASIEEASNGDTVVVFTTSGTNLAYQGEKLNFSAFAATGTFYDNFSGAANQVVSPYFLTTTTIGFDLGNSVISAPQNQPLSATLTQAAANAPSNPAVVNLAVLGVCGDNGRADFSTLNYVYMNEVSTAAAAYALAGYFPTAAGGGSSQNSGLVTLTQPGAAAANLSWPSGDAAAQLGIEIAARNAAQLYDIQGSNVGTGGDGDTHIARAFVPDTNIPATGENFTAIASLGGTSLAVTALPADAVPGDYVTGPGLPPNTYITGVVSTGGLLPNLTLTLSNGSSLFLGLLETYTLHSHGVVPQAMLDTIGNLLANCVDSANTAASPSSQCSTLFSLTPSAGTSGTRPVDTATAAIDLAHNPWANTTTLLNSLTGNAPFQPAATAANDFGIGIEYNYGSICPSALNCTLPDSESVSIDGSGEPWISTYEPGGVAVLSPQGSVSQSLTNLAGSYATAFDSNGDAWITDELGTGTDVYEYTGSTTHSDAYTGTGGGGQTYADLIDASNNVYVAGYSAGLVYKFNASQTTPVQTYNLSGCTTHARGLAVDTAGHLWIASGGAQGAVCMVPAAGGSATFTDASGNLLTPSALALDASGDAWIAEQGAAAGSGLTEIIPSGNPPYFSEKNYSGGGLDVPNGVSIDPAGLVFTSNTASASLSVFSGSGVSLSTATTGLSGSFTSGGTTYTLLSSPRQAAIDASGDVWVPNGGGTWVTEYLGLATPVLTPASASLRLAAPLVVSKP